MNNKRKRLERILMMIFCFIVVFSSSMPVMASADNGAKSDKVRIGWFESAYYITGINGERSGYSYDFLQSVAGCTGWEYEYEAGQWPALLQQLTDGEIDILAAVSYKPEREKDMLFSALPMGQEKYYIFADLSESDISPSDFHSVNGKRVGVVKDSLQADLFSQWAKEHKITSDIVYVDSFADAQERILAGELDCVVASEGAGETGGTLTGLICVGGSDIYYAINKEKPELKEALDRAMASITGTNPFYTEELHRKYIYSITGNALSADELQWLDDHGSIRVGYLRDNLAFSAIDPVTGKLIGALAEYINFARNCMDNKRISFKPIPYDTTKEAMTALKKGDVDVIFPMYRSLYYGEEEGFLFSDTVLTSPLAAVTTENFFNESAEHTVAIYKGNIGIDWYLSSNYPNWKVIVCQSLQEREAVVKAGKADCFVTSAYRVNEYYETKTFYSVYLSQGGSMSFAALRDSTILMSILNKTIHVMPESLMNGTLSMYANPVQKVTFVDFIKDNAAKVFIFVLGGFFLILLVILGFLKKARKAEMVARKANAAKTTFLNNMSHDIRTPMNAIIGFTNLAASHTEEPEVIKDYLGKISMSSNHLLSLINDVLDMSRIESGNMVMEEKEVCMPEFFRALRIIIQPKITERKQKFFIETKNVTTDHIISDKLRLNQIFLNIVGNAIKFTPDEGTIGIYITERPCEKVGYTTFEFRIKDTGIGMSEEFQKHIFETFTREKSSTVSGIQGTGLGMAITKKIVDMMDGTISVVSEEGKGSEFIVVLPCKIATSNEMIQLDEISAGNHKPEPDFWGKKILLVEDNELNQEIAVEILQEEGFVLDVADDGTVAVEKMKKAAPGQYDLILMDIQMPKMDGYEATRQIRAMADEEKAQIPIIAMTANAFDEDKKKALAVGMNGFVFKPIEIPKLMAELKRILG